jgi:predicted peroxiredoxin
MLQGSAVFLAKEGCYEHVFAAGLPPLKDLMRSFIEQGGTLLICTPCIQERKITPDMLIEIAKPVKAARAVMEILEATNVMTY